MITFLSSDYPHPHLENFAENIAVIVHEKRGTINDLNDFLSRTETLLKLQNYMPRWKPKYLGKKPAPDKISFVETLEKIPTVCNNNQSEWEKLRGTIVEKIFETYFSSKHAHAILGFGVVVVVNNIPVIYTPNITTDLDRPRRTVDAGSWDGKYGEFVEVKLRPHRYVAKDINYLKLLEQKLIENSIEHKIILVSFDDTFLLRNYLLRNKLIDDSCRFEFLSHEDFLPI